MDRTKYIGGSNIAAICGVSPWGNATTVWLEKTGQTQTKKDNAYLEWGKRLEAVVADKFFENHPEIKCTESNKRFTHPTYDFISGEVDRLYDGGLLEVKTTNQYNKKDWDDGNIPDHYKMQVQWYLMLTGLKEAWLAVLIGGSDYREIFIEASPELQKLMLSMACDFWFNYVVPKKAPPLLNPDIETVKALYPTSNGKQTTIADQAQLIPTLLDIKAQIKELEEREKELTASIQSAVGEAEAAITNDGKYLVSWKTIERKGYEVKPSSYRKFTVKDLTGKIEGGK